MADSEKQKEQQQTEAVTSSESSTRVEQLNTQWEEETKEQETIVVNAGKAIIDREKGNLQNVKINQQYLNEKLVEIDELLSNQINEIIHNEKFQKLESAWRGLMWLVERTDFKQNIIIEVLNASKEDLEKDFEKSYGDSTTTGLYHHIYTSQYGTPNGKPYGTMVLNYEFSKDEKDIELLSKVSEIANMAHTPVISAIAPDFFGPKGFEHLTDPKYNVKTRLSGEQYAKWNGLRESEDSRYLGLVAPHFLLRTPYKSSDIRNFTFKENINNNANYLWGNAAFAFANRITESFEKYRWCWRILGEESGGKIDNLNIHVYDEHGETVQKPPTDITLAFGKENELFENGIIPLCWLRGKDQAVFYRAYSVKSPIEYPDTEEGNKKQEDDSLRRQIPMMFILSRFAHYIKRIQTSYIGGACTKDQIQKDLTKWIKQYVNQSDNIQESLLGKTPLRDAQILVEDDPKQAGAFLCHFYIIPHKLIVHFKTTLSLVTKTEPKNKK